MNQRKRHSQTIGNGSGPLRSSSIGTDDHGLLVYKRLIISISIGKSKSSGSPSKIKQATQMTEHILRIEMRLIS